MSGGAVAPSAPPIYMPLVWLNIENLHYTILDMFNRNLDENLYTLQTG